MCVVVGRHRPATGSSAGQTKPIGDRGRPALLEVRPAEMIAGICGFDEG
jgi:hypothetical protein